MQRKYAMTKSGTILNIIGDNTEAYKNAMLWSSPVTENSVQPNTDNTNFRRGNEFDSLQRADSLYRDSFMREFDKDVVDEGLSHQATYNEKIPSWDIPAHCTTADHLGTAAGTVTSMDQLTPIEDMDGLSNVWTYFCRQTTFHGAKNIVSPERRRITKIFWLFLVFGMTLGLLYSVLNLLIDYYKYDTITITDIEINTKHLFPSVTLCNNCAYRDTPEVPESIRQIVANASSFPGFFPLNYSDPDVQSSLQMSMVEIQEVFSFRAEEFLLAATYEGKPLNITESFENVDTSIGRCVTFNGPINIAKNGPYTVTSDGRDSGLRVYIHLHQDWYFLYADLTAGIRVFISTYPDTPRLLKDGVDIHPGTSSRVALQPVKYTFLPWPYSSYGGESCDDRPNKELVSKMINATVYSYDSCLEQCALLHCSYECSCYLSNLYVHGLPDCTLGDTLSCHMWCTTYGNWTQLCDCPRPCTLERYDYVVSASQLPSRIAGDYLRQAINASSTAALREDYLELRVYFDTMMKRHERHEPKYTFNSMFAYLGGQMGFFMGASLVTLSELLETLAFSVYVFINKLMRMGQLGNNTKLNSNSQSQRHRAPAVQSNQKAPNLAQMSKSEASNRLSAISRTLSIKNHHIKQAW